MTDMLCIKIKLFCYGAYGIGSVDGRVRTVIADFVRLLRSFLFLF